MKANIKRTARRVMPWWTPKVFSKSFTEHQPCGSDFIRGGPVFAELRTVR